MENSSSRPLLPSQGGLSSNQRRRRENFKRNKQRTNGNLEGERPKSQNVNEGAARIFQRHMPDDGNNALRGKSKQRQQEVRNSGHDGLNDLPAHPRDRSTKENDSRAANLTQSFENLSVNQGPGLSDFERFSGGDSKPAKNKNHNRLKKKNTTCFDPDHRPADMRVLFGKNVLTYPQPFKVRDVVVAPEILCPEEDQSLYNDLLSEIQASGSHSLFVPWHGDSHVIANDRDQAGRWKERSPAFQRVVRRMEEYFGMDVQSTRFNWYRDSSEWKPFHHDAAAIKPEFAKIQNCTVAASLGACRDVTFQHARTGTTVTTPLPNGSLYAFGRDVNVDWKHGIPQLPPEQQHSEGRVSIIAWGWVNMEEVL